MRAPGLVPCDESLVGHNLEQFENGGVGGVTAKGFVNLANRAWAEFPQNLEDFQLTISRLR